MKQHKLITMDLICLTSAKGSAEKKQAVVVALLSMMVGATSFGQGIMDTKTGLLWLPLTDTTNIPENQVNSLYPAYSIASQSQVLQLWMDSGILPGDYTTNNAHPLYTFMNAMGVSYSNFGQPCSAGMYLDPYTSTGAGVASIDFMHLNGASVYSVNSANGWYSANYPWQGVGTYMYEAIPEPSVFALGMLALLALNYRRQSRAFAKVTQSELDQIY